MARKAVPKSNTKGLFLGNDPYMVDAVTEKIFPQLTLEAGSRSHGYQQGAGNSSLQLISLKEGDRTVQLPSLSMEQNYPQMLSELVMHIWGLRALTDGHMGFEYSCFNDSVVKTKQRED